MFSNCYFIYRDEVKLVIEMIKLSSNTLGIYNGNLILFLCALLYLCLKKEKSMYIWIGYIILAFLVFFNPICTKIMVEYCIEIETYWRYLWIVPYGMIIAYVATDIISENKMKNKGIVVFALTLLIVILGKNIYNSSNFEKADNWYKIPQEVVDICDILRESNYEGKVALPESLRYYVRQYDANISVLYTRMLYHTCEFTLLEELEKKEQMDAEVVDEILQSENCNCVIIYNSKQGFESMTRLGYEQIGWNDQYIIMYKRV